MVSPLSALHMKASTSCKIQVMLIRVLLYAKQQMIHSLLLIAGEHKRKPQYLVNLPGPMPFPDNLKGAVHHHERFRVDVENNIF